MRLIKIAFFLFLPILSSLLLGCAEQPRKLPPLQEVFTTTISGNGSKFFEYVIESAVPPDVDAASDDLRSSRGKKTRGDSYPKHISSRDRKKEIAAHFQSRLNAKLESTGFCRDGFFELEKRSILGRIRLRGECKEAATQADREKYQNDNGTATVFKS